jgi:HAD superfamily hydrolase (TIGR01509 family)
MTEKIKHIVFDLDGVLVDSEPLHEAAWSEILRGYGKAFEDNEFKQWVGGTDRARGEYLIKKHNLPIHSEDLLWAKRRMYLEIAQRQLKPFPRVKEGLIWLKERNFQMAVATSSFKQAVTVALTTTGLIDFFDIIVSADDVKRHKPHPDSYLKAVENLSISPQLSYAIEDSASGIKAAKTAGLFTIGVMNSFEKTILHEADLILADTISAIDWILKK